MTDAKTQLPVPAFSDLLRKPVHLLAFGLGTGLAPKAPGTVGTLLGIPLYLLIADLDQWSYMGVVALLFALGVYWCEVTARDLGVHDHPGIVWDEVVGYLITMVAAPSGGWWLLIGFVLFRIFDILKPWPIRMLDREVEGGFGIMLDDVLAGIFAATVMWILSEYVPGFAF